jgi:thioredoxin reductase (NADPH)
VTKPAIVAVDDDPVVVAAITRDLRSRYTDGYRIVRAASAPSVCFVHRYLATI